METIFSEIALEENGSFSVNDDTYKGQFIGARVPHSSYLLNFNYKGNKVIIKNELGVSSFGIIQLKFKTKKDIPGFNMETKNHFLSIFNKKKGTFRIETSDRFLSNFIEFNNEFKKLEKIAKSTKFEPYIIGSQTNNTYTIRTEYSLLFAERKAVLRPMIQFYKDLYENLI